MFDQNGLSLDQAPPIGVVLRFFAIGALYGVLAGAVLVWAGADALEAATPYGRILTHVLTLGVMLSFMLGALFQMLPVVAGVVMPAPLRLAATVQSLLTVGVFSLLWGFWSGGAWAFLLAGVLLGGALLPLAVTMVWRLARLRNHSAASRGMGLALFSLFWTVLLALYLTGVSGGIFDGVYYGAVRTAHYSFGLLGWIALLIVALSFQVIEMFYVTPPHPSWMRRYLGGGVIVFIGIIAMAPWLPSWAVTAAGGAIGVLLALHAAVTLRRFSQRKRPLADATVWFWRMGLGGMMLGVLAKAVSLVQLDPRLDQNAAIFLGIFSVSIVLGMVYKIVPFLTWFHLNAQGYLTAPMMHEIIHPQNAKKHLYLHFAVIVLLSLSPWMPAAARPAGVGLMVSFGWIAYHVFHAISLYRHTQRTGQKFEMPTAA